LLYILIIINDSRQCTSSVQTPECHKDTDIECGSFDLEPYIEVLWSPKAL